MKSFAEHIVCKQGIYQPATASAGVNQVVIAAGALQYPFREDLALPFKANTYFREWLPLLSHPESFLLISDASDQPTLFLKVVADYWHSAPEALDPAIAASVQVVEYASPEDLVGQLAFSGKTAFIGDAAALPQGLQFAEMNPETLLNHIDYHRAWKSDYEMDNMREANRLAIRGHLAAAQAFREERSEREIHMAYLSAVGCLEEELPYSSIVALNQNAAVLHHMALERDKPEQSLSFLIDAGAQVNGCASDITRTYAKEGGHDVFAALIAGMDTMQQDLVAGLKPGCDYVDLHLEAHRQIARLLVELQIIQVTAEQAIDQHLTSAFLPHGLGHLIGVQVHESGGQFLSTTGELRAPPNPHTFLRCTRIVEADMAFTIEPGIYFIPMLLAPWREKSGVVNWSLVDELIPYGGVRIEDNVIVHGNRVENMTRDAFADAA